MARFGPVRFARQTRVAVSGDALADIEHAGSAEPDLVGDGLISHAPLAQADDLTPTFLLGRRTSLGMSISSMPNDMNQAATACKFSQVRSKCVSFQRLIPVCLSLLTLLGLHPLSSVIIPFIYIFRLGLY